MYCPRPCRLVVIALFLVLSKAPVVVAVDPAAEQVECHADGTCDSIADSSSSFSRHRIIQEHDDSHQCSLYLAESVVGAGWGLFAGTNYAQHDSSSLTFGDVSIPLIDMDQATSTVSSIADIDDDDQDMLLLSYAWPAGLGFGDTEADSVVLLTTGIGMLANSHPTLSNIESVGPMAMRRISRLDPAVGATSHLHNWTYSLLKDVATGDELILDYGEEYMEGFRMKTIDESTPPRRANLQQQQDGMCLDNIHVQPSTINSGNGAFARRQLRKNQVVAPVPVLALHRRQLALGLGSEWPNGFVDEIWTGHQLLLNYCYSHPLSSLLLLPYGPGINLVNHANDDSTKPNVALQWSKRNSKQSWLTLDVDDVLHKQTDNQGTGLLLELVALRDIQPGEELFMDYGVHWRRAWDKHVELFRPPVHAETYQSPDVFNKERRRRTLADDGPNNTYYPSFIQPHCDVDESILAHGPMDGGVYQWEATDAGDFRPCAIKSAVPSSIAGEPDTYVVVISLRSKRGAPKKYRISGVPLHSIIFTEKPYTGNQCLRQSFRHPIDLPDDVWPETWKDAVASEAECSIYMAESTIPDAGMGMFTTKNIPEDETFQPADLAILSVEHEDDDSQLLDWYRWSGDLLEGGWSGAGAGELTWTLPGIGMLANSIPGHENLAFGPVNFLTNHRFRHVHSYARRDRSKQAGAFTDYNQVAVGAVGDIAAGSELIVDFGEDYFKNREDLVISGKGLNMSRPVEWLKEHGACLDNMRSGESTLPHAGRGAFAQRFVAKGQQIAPMPMIQMLRSHVETSQLLKHVSQNERQLILNYCYGHFESSLLLLPYSPVVNYVNHNQTLANAKIQWWTSSPVHQADWLKDAPDQIAAQERTGLMMELVATRDIQPGEEIFIDYGDTWELSWQAHVQKWKPPSKADKHMSAAELNHRIEWLYTKDELANGDAPYSLDEDVSLYCLLSDQRLLAHKKDPSISLPQYTWEYESFDPNNLPESWPCEILSRQSNVPGNAMDRKDSTRPILNLEYTALVHTKGDGDVVFHDVPRYGIRFFDKPFRANQFHPQAFRHEIQLPDEMVPESFRDLRVQ